MNTKFRTKFGQWLTDTCCLNKQKTAKVMDILAITERFCDSKKLLSHSMYDSIDYEEIDRICDALLLELESQYHMTIDALVKASEEIRNFLYKLNDYLVFIAVRTPEESILSDVKTMLDEVEILAELEMIVPKNKLLTAGTRREIFGDFPEEAQKRLFGWRWQPDTPLMRKTMRSLWGKSSGSRTRKQEYQAINILCSSPMRYFVLIRNRGIKKLFQHYARKMSVLFIAKQYSFRKSIRVQV